MRLLGLDIGDKRIGVAITDENSTIAYPLYVLENTAGVKEKLLGLINKYDVSKIIVGLPYNLKGQEGHQAKITREFVDINLNEAQVPVIYIDERFTSKISERAIKDKGRKKNKYSGKVRLLQTCGEVDKLSASIILSDYLESINERIKNENK